MRTIEINDKEQFYKLLWWYKKPWYRWTFFKSDIDDQELQDIIEALNIKNRFKRVEFIYDTACKRLDEFYKNDNICEFCNNQCLVQQKHDLKYSNGCCRLCKLQSDKGCTTSNLSCKLFYCDRIRDLKKTLYLKDMRILELYSLRQRIMCTHNYFATRKQFLLDLKLGLFMFFGYHLLYRIVRNFWWLEVTKRRLDKYKKVQKI